MIPVDIPKRVRAWAAGPVPDDLGDEIRMELDLTDLLAEVDADPISIFCG